MSKKLNELILRKKKKGDKILSVFITAGYPQKSSTQDIILALDKSGVDFIELGIPFSDPIADGPVIQAASQKALENGTTLHEVINDVKAIREKSEIPILLMGYLNPFYQYGLEKAMEQCHKIGIDGWIIPDWPLEENRKYISKLNTLDIDIIHLIAPNTPMDRIREIDKVSSSFIYCVAYTGVTGKDNMPTPETMNFFSKIKSFLKHPLMIGFGIKSHQDYLIYTNIADGVIIGSAFIKMLEDVKNGQMLIKIRDFVKNIREG
jgi:tryptophan synthase alpha chain